MATGVMNEHMSTVFKSVSFFLNNGGFILNTIPKTK